MEGDGRRESGSRGEKGVRAVWRREMERNQGETEGGEEGVRKEIGSEVGRSQDSSYHSLLFRHKATLLQTDCGVLTLPRA